MRGYNGTNEDGTRAKLLNLEDKLVVDLMMTG